MEVAEELEALVSIFPEDVKWTQTEAGDGADAKGAYTVVVSIDGQQFMTLKLNCQYPNEHPILIILPFHLESVGLREIVESVIKQEEAGSPILFQVVSTAREWASGHPMCINPQSVLKDLSSASPSEANAPNELPLCRFFLQGKCKFGDKCVNRHGKGHSPASQDSRAKSPTPKKTKKQIMKKESANATGDTAGPQQEESKRKQGKERKPLEKEASRIEEGEKKSPLRTATDVISRILWDPDLPSEEFKIGYLDRFIGIMEKPFSAFSWEDISTVGNNVLAIPKHRIQYFKYREEIVWDKRSQMDNFFGSRGGKVIQEIIGVGETAKDGNQTKDDESEETTEISEADNTNASLQEIDTEDEEEEAEKEGLSRNEIIRLDRNRPTHFICFHIVDEEVKSNVSKIQDNITKLTPQLSSGCLPVTALHVTLCMIRLENEAQIAAAQEVMETNRQQLIHILPRCLELNFTGVSNFRERLIYVKVAPCPPLEKFVSHLMENFHAVGLRTPGNHDEYTPHMSIIKLSRPMQRELRTGVISPALYQPFLNMSIGSQRIESIVICPVAAPKQLDGFYLRLGEVSNSLSGLTAHFHSLLSKRLRFLCDDGVISESERESLSKALVVDSVEKNEQAFNASVEEIMRVGREETMCSHSERGHQPTLIILRGVPGSGKSFLSTHCSEYLKDPTKIAICSADDYFTKNEAYNFSPALLPKAHVHCLMLFLQALDEGKKLIVIDNTNSKLWEYHAYIYLCSILGCQYYILEVPCPSLQVLKKFRSRNLHNVDPPAAARILRRWEADERATLVPPSLAYPRMLPSAQSHFSLISLCLSDGASDVMQKLDALPSITALYIAVFLSTESQWQLLSTLSPTHPVLHAEHITLCFEPGKLSCLAASIGKKISLKVTGSADNGKIQVATVDLPQGISTQNTTSHITVTREGSVSAKTANDVIQSHPVKLLYPPLELEGVIGVCVRETNELDRLPRDARLEEKHNIKSQQTFNVTSETDFVAHVLPKVLDISGENVQQISLPPTVNDASNITICTGEQSITHLYIFDFDGTLFDSPEPKKGKELYEKVSGEKWPHKGWLSWPESLLPPICATPGPALPEFRQHAGRAGSLTVVITGRIERTKSALVRILENFQVYPEQLFLKPNVSDETTAAFKVRILRQLLKDFSNISLVKFWDDLPANLSAVHNLSKSSFKRIQFEIIDATKMQSTKATKHGKKLAFHSPTVPVSVPSQPADSSLQSYLNSCGCLPSDTFLAAANYGLQFIADQFGKIVEFTGDPLLLVYPFGSFPLGRKGDLDVCLLAPPTLTPTDCVEHLHQQLMQCGINYLYKAFSKRCPRLKVMLEFPTCPAVDYDIVFASLADSTLFSPPISAQPTAAEVLSLIKAGDKPSKAALAGPVLLHQILNAIDTVVVRHHFGAVVEMVVQMFAAQRHKGNAYHCIRTFHIVRLLAELVTTQKADLKNTNCDQLFRAFVTHAAKLPDEKWKKLFGEFVPFEFIPKVTKIFARAAQEVSHDAISTLITYEELLDRSAPYPPEGYTIVEINLSGDNKVALWKLHTIMEARLPTYIRQLLSSGIDVLPDGNTGNERKFSFAVPYTKSVRQTLQQVLRPFWNEIEDFRKQKGVQIELIFGQANDTLESGAVRSQQGKLSAKQSRIVQEIEEFSSDPKRSELHLSPQLKSYERMLAHETCERLGLKHAAAATGRDRHIVISK